jgi:hypothetical protein
MKKPSSHPQSPTSPQGASSARAPDPVVEEAISRQLRKLYDDVASEPVPDRFTELLKQLEQQDGKG